MRTTSIAIVIMLALARAGDAEPTAVAVSLDLAEMTSFWATTKVSTEEPIGLRIDRADPVLAKIKLAPGDVIRAVNGNIVIAPADISRYLRVLFLDVARGKQSLVVRVEVRETIEATIERPWLDQVIAAKGTTLFLQATRGGKPSGVAITGFGVMFRTGDLVRSIDGTTVTTIEQAVLALDKAKDKPSILVKLERLDQAVTAKLVIEKGVSDEELDKLAKGIKKLDDTHWELDRAVVDEILANTTMMKKGARIVPAMKDGKPRGLKLYAIRPSSVVAQLGLTNGDTVLAVNGLAMTSIDKTLEAAAKAKQTKVVVLELERRGKPITHTYTVR